MKKKVHKMALYPRHSGRFTAALFYDCRICFITFHSTSIKMFPVLCNTMDLPYIEILSSSDIFCFISIQLKQSFEFVPGFINIRKNGKWTFDFDFIHSKSVRFCFPQMSNKDGCELRREGKREKVKVYRAVKS